MRKLTETIRGQADQLGDEVRKGRDALGLLLQNAQSTLKALNVETIEPESAKREPVLLGAAPAARKREALTARTGRDAIAVRRKSA
jgi:hypothetical protein